MSETTHDPIELRRELALRRDRVRDHTARAINDKIDRLTRAGIDACLGQGREAVARRLVELETEWDIDRALIANFALAGGASFSLGLTRYANKPPLQPRRKGMLYFFGAQLGFLLLHAVVGWCPPASVFRRLGFRTKGEIDAEKHELLRALESGR